MSGTAVDIARAVRAGERSAVDVLDEHLARIAAREPEVHAFNLVLEEQARAAAEAVDRGERTKDAVAHGIRSTAGVVTSAAVVMVAVFAVFATLSSVEFQEMGVGLAAAILIDATIIRGVLLPAVMTLLGERTWWMPGRRPGRRAESPPWTWSPSASIPAPPTRATASSRASAGASWRSTAG